MKKRVQYSTMLILWMLFCGENIQAQGGSKVAMTPAEKEFLSGRLALTKPLDLRPVGLQISGYPNFHEKGFGRAYVHRQLTSGVVGITILTPKSLRPNAAFGFSCHLEGRTAIVGAPGGGALKEGEVYVFEGNGTTWKHTEVLAPFDGYPRDDFGYATLLARSQIMVGAPSANSRYRNTGAVYVYSREISGDWKVREKLQPIKERDLLYFGKYIEMVGDLLLIGAESRRDQTEIAILYESDGGYFKEKKRIYTMPAIEEYLEQNNENPTIDPALLTEDVNSIVGTEHLDLSEN